VSATVFTINPFMKKNPPTILRRALRRSRCSQPVCSRFWTPSSLPAKTFPEFVALAKQQPGKMNYGVERDRLAAIRHHGAVEARLK